LRPRKDVGIFSLQKLGECGHCLEWMGISINFVTTGQSPYAQWAFVIVNKEAGYINISRNPICMRP
jgi:hypothetical protein